jgi:hypothetical protein
MINGVPVTPTPLPAGQVLPAAEIKGRMTIREVSASCAVPLEALLDALNLQATKSDTEIKDLVDTGDLIDVTLVRDVTSTER